MYFILAYANDLVTNMVQLVNGNKVPLIVIPATDLGKVPLGAVSVGNERSVSARLETLEESVKSVVSTVEKLLKNGQPHPAKPGVFVPPPVPDLTVSFSDQVTDRRSYLATASGGLSAGPPQAPPGHPLDRQAGDRRTRSRSPQVKRTHDGVVVDEDGFRQQGRTRNQRRPARPAAIGASKVVVEDVGDLHPSLQYYIGNTPGKADENVIRKVLEKCAAPLLEQGGEGEGSLVIEKVQLLTKEKDPRTKCWRVVVPHRFKALMENSEFYPEGWRYREFVGTFREPSASAKKTRYGDSVVDQVMSEEEQGRTEVSKLQEELSKLRQAMQNTEQSGAGPGQTATQ